MNKTEFTEKLNALTPAQREVLPDFLSGLSDKAIAQKKREPCTENNIRKHIANVCKHFGLVYPGDEGRSHRAELRDLFVRYPTLGFEVNETFIDDGVPLPNPEFPEGAVSATSEFYVSRPPMEERCYEAVMRSGALIRIKAPRFMGKTSLMRRILARASAQDCQTVRLDFGADSEGLQDLDLFLRRFCSRVDRELKRQSQVSEYWDNALLSSTSNCTDYFEECILPDMGKGFVLAIDDVDQVFPHQTTAQDFLGMLRSWHEKGKTMSLWQKLRLVVAHSTEVYVPLNLSQSPFNVGVPMEPMDFTTQQLAELARLHGLEWLFEMGAMEAQSINESNGVSQLYKLVEGHPYLMRLAMYRVSQDGVDLAQLVADAPTEAGIYNHHLRGLWTLLGEDKALLEAYKQVVMSPEPVTLDPMKTYRLHSLGLAAREGSRVKPRYTLYREYFRRVLS